MAGLTAAWELSRPEHRDVIASVTLYESSDRLGGKGASSRGIHGRIEEHGLHVWLGYYDNAFRLIRQVYDELDRPRTDPECPIRTWHEAFRPADVIGARDREGQFTPWMARLARNELEPGDPDSPARPLGTAELVRRSLTLMYDAARSLSPPDQPAARVFLSTSADPTKRRQTAGSEATALTRLAQVATLAGAAETMTVFERYASGPIAQLLADQVASLHRQLRDELARDDTASRTWVLVDLVATCLRGAIADGLLGSPERYTTVDDLDFRQWLLGHGASHEAACSPLVNGMYDFVFAYEDGDHQRPAFSAGLGLFLATKLFFEYRGSVFWKMNAGMGDVVFAPLYQALIARGVRVEFGHHVRHVGLDDSRSGVETLDLSLATPSRVEPLVRVKGLPCFPSERASDIPRRRAGELTLRRGDDFDTVVLAAALGALPAMCSELIEASPRWSDMCANIGTVSTAGFQAWLTETEADLGWPFAGATVSGGPPPFDTYASMGHLLEMENWPDNGNRPRGLAYFCTALPDRAAEDDDPAREAARHLLTGAIDDLWPQAPGADGFDRLLHGGFEGQHFTTNDAPSDRYVQSLPGTARFRLRADQSGFDAIVLAGDWINSGLNAGCIEAAVISGLEAANVVLGRPLARGVSGSLYGLADEGATI
jgi:uncharacterized protein with NAD-binding domain and iron-sulfur cluster